MIGDDVDDVIDALQRHYADQLSEWEESFLESIAEQWEDRVALTVKQREKLEQIFDRVSQGGRSGGRPA